MNTTLCLNLVYSKEFEDHNISNEQLQDSLSKISKNILTCFGFSTLAIVFSSILLFSSFPILYSFYYVISSPFISKFKITEAFTSTTTRTIGLSGISTFEKVNYLSQLSKEYKKTLSIVTSNFTEANFKESFQFQVVFVEIQSLNREELNLICEYLKKSSSIFFGGCLKEEKIDTFKGCRTNLEKIYFSQQVNYFSASVLVFSFLFVCFSCSVFLMGIIIQGKKLKEFVAVESNSFFESHGMKMSLRYIPYVHLHFESVSDQPLMHISPGENEDVIYDQLQEED
jgi:hypothetical protein